MGAPIPSAIVQITELNVRTTATANGSYTLQVPEGRATGQQVVVLARFIGYRPVSRPLTLTAGTHELEFRLEADPFRLEEVVVTGVAEATSSRKLTFSVAKVSEEQLKEVPATSPVQALAGKVAGVRVSSGRGSPGGEPAIRLRGSTNLTVGGSAPLIIVDGVITRNNISDIDANDVESIEVLKGAAASAFYGSDAANGVINVTTKRGRNLPENRVAFTLRSEYGQSDLPRMIPLMRHHPFQVNAQGEPVWGTFDADGFADNPFPSSGPTRWRNQLEEWLTNGQFNSTNLQMGLRRGNTNFNSSVTYEKNQGILPMTDGLTRRNVRLNLDQGISSQADFSASLTYGLQNNDFDPANAATGVFFALLQSPPNLDLRWPDPVVVETCEADPNARGCQEFWPAIPGNNRGNPLYELRNEDYNQRRERILGSFAFRYRPWDWMRLEASYGTDRLNRQDREYQFRGYLNLTADETEGSIDLVNYNNWASNAQVSATATRLFSTRTFLGDVLSTTRVAALREDTHDAWVQAGGNELNVGGVPDLDAVEPLRNYVDSQREVTRTINYMASQALDIRDRYLLDVLYRRDGSSLFGADNRWEDFYRVSGAYRISEDFRIPGVQELKIRAARGTAGLRPTFAAQFETYDISGGSFSKDQLGNRSLRPAVQTEDEIGVNLTFLDRFDLELVQANRLTKDAFLLVPLSLAKSAGFRFQWQNAADIKARTTELSLQTRVIERPNISYTFSLTGDRTRQEITRMNRAPFRPTFTGQGQNQHIFYYKAGEPLGIIYGQRWVRSFAELSAAQRGTRTEADYTVNPLGYLVLSTNPIQPIRLQDANGGESHVIGDVNPDFSFGWANNLRLHGFNIYALLDGQRGGDVYNFSKHWMFQDYRHGDIDQSGKPDNEKVRALFYSVGLYNALEPNEYFVEDASYVKLRELSVSYTLGEPLLRRIGINRYANGVKVALIGRNLYTWTDFSGFDPDVTSGGDFNFRIEGFRYPQFRTITGQVEIQF